MRKKMAFQIAVTVISLMVIPINMRAQLNPSGTPAATNSYTLEDLYNRLTSGTAGTQHSFNEPATGPVSSTMHTINQLMTAAPQINASGAEASHVRSGYFFWGLTSGAWGLQQGTASPAPVAKTGQTTSFAAGDDGNLQKGIAWPTPRFADNGDGTITDNATGLLWLKNANIFGTKTWSSSLSECNSLSSGAGGLSDGSTAGEWRLPNRAELASLLSMQYAFPALSNTAGTAQWSVGNPFTGVQNNYWTSTAYAGGPSAAWYVEMQTGVVNFSDKTTTQYVWPVRNAH